MKKVRSSSIRMTRGDRIFCAVNYAAIALLLLVIAYPLYVVVIASFSDPYSVVRGEVYFWFKGFSLDAYKNVFREARVWRGYANTLRYTVFGTALNLLLTIPAGYVLGKKQLVGRGAIAVFFLIPMYFGGGLIPTYLLLKSLRLLNQPYTLILMGGVSVYNVVVTRVFFQTSIPEELFESAHMDGASHMRSFLQIALPLAAPIVAVMALFYAVGRWNSYYDALVYVIDSDYMPLQIVLRSILLLNQSALSGVDASQLATDSEMLTALARQQYMAEAMKYSLIIIAALPLLVAYPFVQKYFVRGMLIGSLKG